MKQILTLVLVGITTCLSAQIDLSDNLLFYYQLEDNINDASAKENNGVAKAITYADGKIDNGAVFATDTSYIQSPAALIDPATNDLTVAAWIKINSFTDKSAAGTGEDAIKMVCQMQDGTGKGRSFLYVNPAGNYLQSYLGGSTVTGVDSIPENEWAHIALAITAAESKATLYYNGVVTKDSVTKKAIEFCDGEFNFGIHKINADGSMNMPSRTFDGTMDEIALFNKALTVDEIKSLMEHGAMTTTSIRYVSSNQNIVKVNSLTNGVLDIDLDDEFTSNSARLNIYDMAGKKWLSRSVVKGENLVQTSLDRGHYVLTIDSEAKTFSTKVFIK